MHLPGLGGIELCQTIRRQAEGRNHDTPILAFTANVLPGMVRRYFEAGMQGVLGKPLRLEELRRALAGVNEPLVPVTDAGPLDLQVLATHRQLLGEHKLGELLASLRRLLDEQLPMLDEALRHDDPTEVANIAHRLAGSCQSMGLRALGGCLRELENAALAGEELAGWAERVDACREEAMRELDS
ncbi:Aerobic respiration control sensor protein ArcB [compost metagenome]